jgi:hypothetical protein
LLAVSLSAFDPEATSPDKRLIPGVVRQGVADARTILLGGVLAVVLASLAARAIRRGARRLVGPHPVSDASPEHVGEAKCLSMRF